MNFSNRLSVLAEMPSYHLQLPAILEPLNSTPKSPSANAATSRTEVSAPSKMSEAERATLKFCVGAPCRILHGASFNFDKTILTNMKNTTFQKKIGFGEPVYFQNGEMSKKKPPSGTYIALDIYRSPGGAEGATVIAPQKGIAIKFANDSIGARSKNSAPASDVHFFGIPPATSSAGELMFELKAMSASGQTEVRLKTGNLMKHIGRNASWTIPILNGNGTAWKNFYIWVNRDGKFDGKYVDENK